MLTEQEKAELREEASKIPTEERERIVKRAYIAEARKTLWDEYFMAALTGMLANQKRLTGEELIFLASGCADAAMEERKRRV